MRIYMDFLCPSRVKLRYDHSATWRIVLEITWGWNALALPRVTQPPRPCLVQSGDSLNEDCWLVLCPDLFSSPGSPRSGSLPSSRAWRPPLSSGPCKSSSSCSFHLHVYEAHTSVEVFSQKTLFPAFCFVHLCFLVRLTILFLPLYYFGLQLFVMSRFRWVWV